MICSSLCRCRFMGSDRYAPFGADPQPGSGLITGASSQRSGNREFSDLCERPGEWNTFPSATQTLEDIALRLNASS